MPSLSEPIDTPPVLYHQSFVDNAAITSHADMKYTFTLPILTAENSSQKSKLIVEVWHIISLWLALAAPVIVCIFPHSFQSGKNLSLEIYSKHSEIK
jgi:hypothetical protein